MDFHGITDEFGLRFAPNILNQRTLFLRSIKPGTRIKETIVKDRSSKTQKQCAAIFGVYIPIIRQKMIDQGTSLFGCAPSKDFVKEILYKTCGGVGDHGESKTLSRMDITEAGRFIENIQDFCAKNLDLVLPQLDPSWRDHFKER